MGRQVKTAVQTHALLRAKSGFDIAQLAAEYHALRVSVIRLWGDHATPESTDLYDIIRFNEAIDQALAESICFYTSQVEQSRNLFLGMLGHDLRNALQTILMTASTLVMLNDNDKISEASARLIRSGSQMQELLDDLLDYNRNMLGLGIDIIPKDADLGQLMVGELDQLRAAYPARRIVLEMQGFSIISPTVVSCSSCDIFAWYIIPSVYLPKEVKTS